MVRHLPNALTLLRLVIGPAGALCLVLSYGAGAETPPGGRDFSAFAGHVNLLAALALAGFLIGAATDFADGWIARRYNVRSDFGALMDPIADKVFVAAFLLAWVWVFGAIPIIAVPAAAIIARDVLVTAARLRRLNRAGTPLPVTFTAKAKTAVEMVMLGFPFLIGLLALAGIEPVSWLSIEIWISLLLFAACLSLYTGFGYLREASRA